ncbi:MAG: protein-export membrane protein SecD [Candidatus Taylorbacteria bacterium RIFCSPLOWO2_02_FULL_43_11]|uniref:Protein translocase subunit SecD n=1 Tax=Candidatus Taylorbacteria bacterium RIFCSPHIGHO2_02_FULL_43_32b TaxID=1802306 RepID=A0A1G2MJY5_9BACT|nr:MAG: protein-export membrane protein SecD [Candidatus Taylorbacteria bacterium RIFCSPHIGHO2_01_FULL_43_47]OHA23331.1 MAG: protein-export membrane protein SecD [Candidatus Taylorbacteria bacterium RIFCSPHIGHO2_02_FULL_43_32b]OHA30304.1 MAG: protein-export membrane protein SecD [Candidatus Taylorbacteria bacterium RIFCSPLOWO2_01_FULL_43_44]OHA36900.1 MAG: protein-export membrane protein SecD [Candidatus Taylorbacteria bacterium RIFCSPLOWO2_02_FULL_43_11]
MAKRRISALILIAVAAVVGYFVYQTELVKMVPGETASSTPVASVSNYAFKLGLDLNGGTHLVYRADTSKVLESDINSAMTALRDVIERRVNMFGVSEPLVQVEEGGVLGSGREERLIVELPGVTDVKDAVAMIGQTPLLEFKLANEFPGLSEEELQQKTIDEVFSPTGLTGQYLKRATLTFDPNTGEPQVTIDFNSEGKKMFGDITRDNIGRVVAIFLDGVPISTPVIREVILEGTAQISGNFKIDEARTLVRNLNYGALPMPISLVSTETIGPSLGTAAVNAGLKAGLWSFVIIAIFLIVWYRLPGLLASIALLIYVILNLAIFKLIPVTLTAAGIAGFVLSLGMAVDANILIFERMKEELKMGRTLEDAMKEGFARAWLSIRDSNLSSIITATILYFFATTNIIKGFALVFGIGVLTSMFTAITASRTLLLAMRLKDSKLSRFLFTSGIR